jgi:hypothetical protein
LNYISGSVSFRPDELDDWSAAVINLPLKTGDHLWADVNSRAEIHVGSTAIRVGPETAFTFLNLDDHAIQIQLNQGALNIRVRQLVDADFVEVDTPNSAVSLLRPGWYRVNVDAQGDTTVIDRSGESEVTAQGQALTLHPLESATISGIDALTYDIQPVSPADPWDNWCAERDRREDQAVSARYVPREMVGYEDLDVYGSWRTDPDYGPVWVPASVPGGWAPYRYGHWIWVDPWGWTWVDDMPWGFAPFHYGRWVRAAGVWVWTPGRIVARPVYAPALVVFIGGGNWQVSIGSGVAWFPLGPREVYVPTYHVGPEYVRRVNITHVNVTNINITNVNVVNTTYVNRNAPGAVTVVRQSDFVRAQPVSRTAVSVSPQAMASAPLVGTAPRVAPGRESLIMKSAAAPARPPAQVSNRQVVAKATPPPRPVPFAAKQAALGADPGKPLDSAAESNLRRSAAPAPVVVKQAIPGGQPTPGAVSGFRPVRPEIGATHPVKTASAAVKSQAPPLPVVPIPSAAGRASRPSDRPANDRPPTAAAPATRPAPVPAARPVTPQPAAPAQSQSQPQSQPQPQPNTVRPPAERGAASNQESNRPVRPVAPAQPQGQPQPQPKAQPQQPAQPQSQPQPQPNAARQPAERGGVRNPENERPVRPPTPVQPQSQPQSQPNTVRPPAAQGAPPAARPNPPQDNRQEKQGEKPPNPERGEDKGKGKDTGQGK